jgi:hypothetical protein
MDFIRDFLRKSEISVHVLAIVMAIPKCKNDISIMDKAVSLGFKPHELLHINRCQIYLQASTISNKSSADGTMLRNGIRECREEACIQSLTLWPRQARPGPNLIHYWKRFITGILFGILILFFLNIIKV